MKIGMIASDGKEQAAVLCESGWLPVSQDNNMVSSHFPETLIDIITADCGKNDL